MSSRCLILAVVTAALALAPASAGGATPKTVWLCRPGLPSNPCTPGLSTSLFSPSGQPLGPETVRAVSHPRIDCFYVYPTVSDQPTPLANLHIDPAERSIALYQAARFSQYCRVFAPVYRQKTLSGPVGLSRAVPFADVSAAWRTYLKRYHHGRGFVLIGHSQGAIMLDRLMATAIDGKRKVRRKLVSAFLLGDNVMVKPGTGVGGDFKHIPACTSPTQIGCVVSYATFDGPVPPNSPVGIPGPGGLQVLCTNPAALAGGRGTLDPIFPSTPFAPGTTWAQNLQAFGLGLPAASTTWIDLAGSYTAQCTSANGANVLQIAPAAGAPTPKPDPVYGLHFLDANIALGNLVSLVRTEADAYLARRG